MALMDKHGKKDMDKGAPDAEKPVGDRDEESAPRQAPEHKQRDPGIAARDEILQNWPGTVKEEKPKKKKPSAEEFAELHDKYLRALASHENLKRRTEKEKAELANFIKKNLYLDILPVLDSFERFFQHVEERRDVLDQDFVLGVEMIHKSLVSALNRQGVETIAEVGVTFDPHRHEAVMTQAVEKEEEDHTVREVLEVGYRIGDLIIRPSKVRVGILSLETED